MEYTALTIIATIVEVLIIIFFVWVGYKIIKWFRNKVFRRTD